jgi:hypothetical protein
MSPRSKKPFCLELIFATPGVTSLIHRPKPCSTHHDSLSNGNIWVASNPPQLFDDALMFIIPVMTHLLSRSLIPSRKLLSRPDMLWVISRCTHGSFVTTRGLSQWMSYSPGCKGLLDCDNIWPDVRSWTRIGWLVIIRMASISRTFCSVTDPFCTSPPIAAPGFRAS